MFCEFFFIQAKMKTVTGNIFIEIDISSEILKSGSMRIKLQLVW